MALELVELVQSGSNVKACLVRLKLGLLTTCINNGINKRIASLTYNNQQPNTAC